MAAATRTLMQRNAANLYCCCRGMLVNRVASFSTKPAENEETEAPQTEQKLCKGINYLKDGSDPPLLPDNQYPAWLWELLEPEKEDSRTLERRYNKKQRRQENEIRKQKKF